MRVALVTENFLPKLDGVTRTLAMLLEHLERHGDRVLVLGPETAPKRYAGARILRAPGVPLPFYPELRLLLPRPEFGRMLSRFRPDIVHVVDPMALGAAGIRWARRLRAPLLASYHTNLAEYCTHFHMGMLAGPVWAYRRMLHNQCDATLCPSPSTMLQLHRRGFSQLGVWGRGVDASLFHPARRSMAWRTRMTGGDTRPILLYVGRLSHEKNLEILARAFCSLRDLEAQLVIVGDGPARAQLERLLAGQPVTFTGYLRGEALATAYASADLFAFPSLTETFGQVVLEAMASGLPVVAFDAEGVCDLVSSERTGYLVRPGDADGFASALRTLMSTPEPRLRLGICARLHAEQRAWGQVMDELIQVYELLIARRMGRAA
ncbi:MAG: glycosyltransferase family 1 protein [Ktedonobacterales bacterium]|nr:glycosyltransferase family 1 protein [Ktedonobacterales bacterium]